MDKVMLECLHQEVGFSYIPAVKQLVINTTGQSADVIAEIKAVISANAGKETGSIVASF